MRAQNFHGKYKLLKMSETVLKFVHQVPLINWVHSKKQSIFREKIQYLVCQGKFVTESCHGKLMCLFLKEKLCRENK